MKETQPLALRLADMVERYNAGVMSQKICEDYLEAADELRRLHSVNAELLEALKGMVFAHRNHFGLDGAWDQCITVAEAAIAKATGKRP